ncbi:MAG TPA: hypothetical protein VLJ76_02670 [Gaiellaceae bacterium]|nr:hypothetical protein [Gaiellaceae bacterium]
MLGIVGALMNAALMVVRLVIGLVTTLAKMLTGLVRAILPGK